MYDKMGVITLKLRRIYMLFHGCCLFRFGSSAFWTSSALLYMSIQNMINVKIRYANLINVMAP